MMIPRLVLTRLPRVWLLEEMMGLIIPKLRKTPPGASVGISPEAWLPVNVCLMLLMV